MTYNIATEIEKLVNKRNNLSKKITNKQINDNLVNYVCLVENNNFIGCVQVKKIQWYQSEICHFSIKEEYEGKGKSYELIKMAEEKAKNENSRIIQCTIRKDNTKSINFFTKNNYIQVNEFFNKNTNNNVLIFQKII